MNQDAVGLLALVAEDLRATDPVTYNALSLAISQGARAEVQIKFGPEASISLGFRDDYERSRWLHTCPLQ